jgi:hypothetical protein
MMWAKPGRICIRTCRITLDLQLESFGNIQVVTSRTEPNIPSVMVQQRHQPEPEPDQELHQLEPEPDQPEEMCPRHARSINPKFQGLQPRDSTANGLKQQVKENSVCAAIFQVSSNL